MFNDQQYNQNQYNADGIKRPAKTTSEYPKTESKITVWSPTGDITDEKTTTQFPP